MIVERVLVGTFMTSLNMAGVSISLMHVHDDMLAFLDAPSEAPAWPRVISIPNISKPRVPLPANSPDVAEGATEGGPARPSGPVEVNADLVHFVVQAAAQACVDAEEDLTRFDTLVCPLNSST
jgi:triose/dihydroxyacetone kinase / FAD-AMP lyase (cyclizing)